MPLSNDKLIEISSSFIKAENIILIAQLTEVNKKNYNNYNLLHIKSQIRLQKY